MGQNIGFIKLIFTYLYFWSNIVLSSRNKLLVRYRVFIILMRKKGRLRQMLTLADNEGEGIKEMLPLANKGGGG